MLRPKLASLLNIDRVNFELPLCGILKVVTLNCPFQSTLREFHSLLLIQIKSHSIQAEKIHN